MAKPANKVFDVASASAPKRAIDVAAGEPVANPAGEEPAERSDFPCSLAQERFWLLDRLDPGNSAYNVAVRWRLEGRVATDLLERAWLAIIERHEVLRSVFPEIDGAPNQRVLPRAQFRLTEIDLSNLSAELQQTEGDRIGVIEARAPFDLASGPLIRVTLLRLSPTVSIILVTTHQIVSDGWSIGIMAREMGLIYSALRQGAPVGLEPLAIQYADYSEWQLEWLKVRGTEAETAYWSRQLAGVKPFRVRPDHPRPTMPTTNGAIVSRLLPRALTNRAQALSAERGATLFATAFAAVCATLARFTNETEVVVGTQVSGRDQVELEPMIGQFVNSLILRNNLAGNPVFAAIVDGVRETIAQALEHRHIPIERLLGMVRSERSDASTPPISVNFIFQKTFIQNTAYGDFALVDMPSLPAGAIYDLNLFMVERPDGWRFSCQYNTDQFDHETAERLLAYTERLLDSAVSNPMQRLSDLPLAPADEARQLVGRLNDTRMLYPRDLALGQLFEAQAARSAEAVAVVCAERQLTYGELNSAATRFCAHLREQGIVAGSRVGVSLAASLELPICLLGILKAGAAYVTLDPDEPPLRQAALIRASGAIAVVGLKLDRAMSGHIQVPLIDAAAVLAAGAPAVYPPVTTQAEAVACMLSVSSRDPQTRAVALSHRMLVNLIYSLAKRPGCGAEDVVIATPLSLGRAAVELLLPLLTGARLVIALERDLANGRNLSQLLQRTNATLMYGEPEDWNGLLDAQWTGRPAFKMLVPANSSAALKERLVGLGGEVWSLFGQAETGIWSATRLVKSKESIEVLGEPIANTGLYVLDAVRSLTAVGAVGELHVGGDGLGERALAAAVMSESGARLYPTGSLARVRVGGQIEFLGRTDDVFVYAGRSIEPAEIEEVLLRHPAVVRAAAVSVKDPAGMVEIAAFVTTGEAAQDPPAGLLPELRDLLAKNLPRYMQPTRVMVREALPMRLDGSVDRAALHGSKERSMRSVPPAQLPAGAIESRLAALWVGMLGVDGVSGGDNFFELGGHSLLAARMLTQVEREFGKRIKLATLFMSPTLSDFAKILGQAETREFDFRQVVKIQPHGSKRPLIAINNTGIYYGLARNLGPEQPVYSLQLFDPSVRDSTLPETLEEVAAGYVSLIRRVQPQGPYDLAGWCVAGALALEIARQLGADRRDEIANLFLIDSWVPNYFSRVPKLRGLIGNYSLRGQLIMADFRRVLSGEKSFVAFLKQRTMYRRIARLFGGLDAAEPPVDPRLQSTPETYDQWLLAYLQRLTARYQPKTYPGRVTLLRSRLEPSGWLFLEDAGWGEFVPAGIEVRFVDGNHFTMFQDPGSHQMARYVAAALEKSATSKSVGS